MRKFKLRALKKMDYKLYGSQGTADYFRENDIDVIVSQQFPCLANFFYFF